MNKIIKFWIKRYQVLTERLLPIQQKLLLSVIISGVIFLLLDINSLLNFFEIYNKTYHWSGNNTLYRGSSEISIIQYAQENFMFPHPASFNFFKEYLHSIYFYNTSEFQPLWHWYSDKVMLTGIIFITTVLLFLISTIMSMVNNEQFKKPRGGE